VRRVRELLLTLSALAGVTCMVSAVAAWAFGVHLLVFMSGSMSPAIDTGALGLAHSVTADELRTGDIVSVTTASGTRVTHRIKAISLAEGRASLVLKGDANTVADKDVYVVTHADRVLLDVPRAGYVASWLAGPFGLFAGGLVTGGLLLLAFGRRSAEDSVGGPTPDPPSGEPRGRWRGRGTASAGVAVGIVLVASVCGRAAPQPTAAYYTDSAAAVSGVFARTNQPVAPVIVTCAGGGGADLNLTWTWPTAANGSNPDTFEVRYNSTPAHATVVIAGGLRTASITGHNSVSGQVWIVAIVGGIASPDSAHYVFSGNGSNRVCNPAP
jgi:signal peptidase I